MMAKPANGGPGEGRTLKRSVQGRAAARSTSPFGGSERIQTASFSRLTAASCCQTRNQTHQWT